MVLAAVVAASIALQTTQSTAQSQVLFVGMGDSIGEGVQSGDANEVTQPFSFLNLMALHMGASFPLPMIRTGLFGAVGSTDGRSRVDLSTRSLNLAVSGADSGSILYDASTATSAGQIDTETELVLFPRLGAQIDIAEALRPQYIACWIGNNDALSAALSFDQLNATQLTPVPEFTANFTQLVDRIDAIGARAVFATIPDITAIGYLLNRDDLIRFLGSSYGLPPGGLVGLPAMFMVRLGLLPTSIFADPNYVLDPGEQQIVSNHITQLNAVIASVVQSRNMALVDAHGIFQYIAANGLNLFGVNLTTRFLGGIFSLDGVHPSNIGHGIATLFFIDALNQRYGANIAQIDGNTLLWLTFTDPFIDKDGDGRVAGRLGGGLLETVFSVLGISGDSSDTPAPAAATGTLSAESTASEPALATTESASQKSALDELAKRTGRDWRKLSRADRLRAAHRLFGTSRLAR
jgi:GDSL-like lipase/acylhydrolase family protein